MYAIIIKSKHGHKLMHFLYKLLLNIVNKLMNLHYQNIRFLKNISLVVSQITVLSIERLPNKLSGKKNVGFTAIVAPTSAAIHLGTASWEDHPRIKSTLTVGLRSITRVYTFVLL